MWDPIMQVGKTPQITADANLNPYTIAQDDITQLSYPFLAQLGSQTTLMSGSVLNLTNQFYDYTVSDAIYFRENGVGTGTDTIMTFDLGKALNVRGISFLLAVARDSTDSNGTVYLEGTEDGSTWTQYDSYAIPNTSGAKTFYTMQASDKRFKTLRIRIDWAPGSGGFLEVYGERLRIWVDSKQYFY